MSVIYGPNLNMLGARETELYGTLTLEDINMGLSARAGEHAVLTFFKSNCEGGIITHIQSCAGFDGIIINAAGYTHTSVAIRDALLAVNVPYVEVHMSNIFAREDFRHKSYLSDKAAGIVCGLKEYSYYAALEYFLKD
ncbi:MAG: 3-dehydroquinate dehydratase [Deferribacteraceae bacterium]|nr:3-dehydroquinate dehydratase [Deferribacteraceae bacterium]